MRALRRTIPWGIAMLVSAIVCHSPWANGREAQIAANKGSAHWAFQPLKKINPPHVKDSRWLRTGIDSFVLARLEENGFRPAPVADKRTLLRRATFDLI